MAMDIADWRKKIDELDRRLVELLNERAQTIFANVCRANRGPLPDSELRQVYERIIDVMRNIQKNEIAPKIESGDRHTEFDVEVND
jgi:chorismate mutase/prephenate dehydratase